MKIFFLLSLLAIFLSCDNTGSSLNASNSFIKKLQEQLIANPSSQADKDKNAILQYAIKKQLDVKSTPSGIYYKIIQEGSGDRPAVEDFVQAHYVGQLLDGTIFDSSRKAGRPLDFNLRNMIKGWQEVIPMLKTGGKGIFLIPSHLAYGKKGFSRIIAPDTPLLFEIELLKVETEDLY